MMDVFKKAILSGVSKLKRQTDYDGRIQELLNKCNCQIDELESCAKKASPELRDLTLSLFESNVEK